MISTNLYRYKGTRHSAWTDNFPGPGLDIISVEKENIHKPLIKRVKAINVLQRVQESLIRHNVSLLLGSIRTIYVQGLERPQDQQ